MWPCRRDICCPEWKAQTGWKRAGKKVKGMAKSCLLVVGMKEHKQTVYLSLFVRWVMLTECCRCYFLMSVWFGSTAWKMPWWVGFKEPCRLFHHQKVHLGASAIFYPFPQLRLGFILMSNSLCLCHLSSRQSFDPSSISVLCCFKWYAEALLH